VINQNQGECSFFINLVPQARKRVKLIPENTLLANRRFLEYTFIRTIDHPDRKRGKLPPDRRAFKFEFGEREGKQDRSTIFSCLESLKRA
jgi:hypothetical protein